MSRPIDPKRQDLWTERIKRQAQSDLSIARFCFLEGISPVTFSAWKRRLNRARPNPKAQALTATPVFLPVTLAKSESPQVSHPPILIELPNGVQIHLPSAHHDLAAKLLPILATLNPSNSRSQS
jgi:hypothetical protein